MGVSVEVEDLTVSYGATPVLHRVSVAVGAGEFVALLGPSGCGKTTLLRSIAGFVKPSGGVIRAGTRDITHAPPERRGAAMVFQSYALWPHMSVAKTIGYGLAIRGWDKARIAARVEEMLRLLRLEGLGARLPAQLSGGQRQRVALGRALAVDPEILLLDEPMSNLDARVREGVRHELRALQRDLGITAIHVTHDREEAMILADRIVILHEGRVAQHGSPEDLWARPASAYVADFLGATNRLPVRVRDGMAEGAEGEPPLRLDPGRAPPAGASTLHFRPEEARLLAPGEGIDGLVFHGTVALSAYPGGRWRAAIRVAGQEVLVDVPERVAQGAAVRLGIPAAAAHLFAATEPQQDRRAEVTPAH
ncbi:ABC transporter ATP-binding protein [Falsiroseomonas oryzae]|uniref:ABC transporter ATP-binding protein n=1 Tax=Falsiroseomonas oryzae TaxID=2766473 RepID=UPI0022EB7095|nr:ABC transporter ATP-binding protein [Roseomonas sp. MO-31]